MLLSEATTVLQGKHIQLLYPQNNNFLITGICILLFYHEPSRIGFLLEQKIIKNPGLLFC